MKYLYHVILSNNHKHHVSVEKVLNEGISPLTESNYWYGKGGGVQADLTEKLKPKKAPNWVDFKKAVGVELAPRGLKFFKISVFTDKILVFNKEYSDQIFNQVFFEDNKYTFEEALDFNTGESIEHWITLYWGSMMTLDEYKVSKPYLEPEVLVFEPIPKEIIQVCEE